MAALSALLTLGSAGNGLHFSASNELVLFQRYHAEVVSDRVPKILPFIREGFAEEVQYRFCKLVKGAVVLIVSDPPMHNAPEPFNRVQVRSVWGQKVKSHSSI